MARARNIKPGFFKNEFLAELSAEARLLFIGLWTLADREGRLEDRPKRIRAELFPFESIDAEPLLADLANKGFIERYSVSGVSYIYITNFVLHQDPHYKEKASVIPPVPGRTDEVVACGVTRSQRKRIIERDERCMSCGSLDSLTVDHIIPVSRGGDSSDENLQALCSRCNASKSNRLDGEKKGVNANKNDKPSIFNPNLSQVHPELEPSSNQPSRTLPSDSLIPDSLNTDSLIPEKAEAAPQKNPVESRIWDDGVELLSRSGLTLLQAKPLLGRLVRDYGKIQVAESIAAAQAQNPADPKTYLIGVLKGKLKDKAKGEVGKHTEPETEVHCKKCLDAGEVTVKPNNPKYEWEVKFIPCPDCKPIEIAA